MGKVKSQPSGSSQNYTLVEKILDFSGEDDLDFKTLGDVAHTVGEFTVHPLGTAASASTNHEIVSGKLRMSSQGASDSVALLLDMSSFLTSAILLNEYEVIIELDTASCSLSSNGEIYVWDAQNTGNSEVNKLNRAGVQRNNTGTYEADTYCHWTGPLSGYHTTQTTIGDGSALVSYMMIHCDGAGNFTSYMGNTYPSTWKDKAQEMTRYQEQAHFDPDNPLYKSSGSPTPFQGAFLFSGGVDDLYVKRIIVRYLNYTGDE